MNPTAKPDTPIWDFGEQIFKERYVIRPWTGRAKLIPVRQKFKGFFEVSRSERSAAFRPLQHPNQNTQPITVCFRMTERRKRRVPTLEGAASSAP